MAAKPLARTPGSDSFARWAFLTVARLQKAVGVGALVAAVVGTYTVLSGDFLSTWNVEELRWRLQGEGTREPRANLALIQGIICFALASLLPRPRVSTLEAIPNTGLPEDIAPALRRIHDSLRVTFMLWSGYYVASWLCILTSVPLDHDSHVLVLPPLAEVVTLSLNAATGLSLFWLFLELSEITDESGATERGVESYQIARVHKLLSGGVLAILLLVAWLGLALGGEASAAIGYVAGAVAYLSGLSQCLVTGRLGSKLIDPGPVTLAALYMYALLQPLAISFPSQPEVQLLATSVALVLKVLLWLVFVWAFSTGLVGEYVSEIRDLLLSPEGRRAAGRGARKTL